MANHPYPKRRDAKHRVLRIGESIRPNGKYQFKYYVNNEPRYLYSWRLEPTDRQPQGTRPTPSLREMEKQLGLDMESRLDPSHRNMTVIELVDRYLATKTGVKPSTREGYETIRRQILKVDFSGRKIHDVKTSEAKLFLIKLQKEGLRCGTIKGIRGVLRPAFQMAVDDDMLGKNPFNFDMSGVLVNDTVPREAISPEQMHKFLKFVHEDDIYCRYYEGVYILFHTGLRISEFCGLTIRDIDLKNNMITIDHQLQRATGGKLIVESTKTNAGTRKLPISRDVADMFQAILEDRPTPRREPVVGGHWGFLYLDSKGMPEVASHWQNRFVSMVRRYNETHQEQMPKITPHVCRHTYCSNMARAGMNPKTLQYLMGHSDIGVTMNTYTHLGLMDAETEMQRLQEAARAEQEKISGEPLSRKLFRVI